MAKSDLRIKRPSSRQYIIFFAVGFYNNGTDDGRSERIISQTNHSMGERFDNDFRRRDTVYSAISRNPHERRRRRLLPLRVPRITHSEYTSHPILVRIGNFIILLIPPQHVSWIILTSSNLISRNWRGTVTVTMKFYAVTVPIFVLIVCRTGQYSIFVKRAKK